MTHQQQPQEQELVTMFGLEQAPDGGAILTLTTRDEHGDLWRGVYQMDPRVTCAVRQAVLDRLTTAATPAAIDEAAARSRALLASHLTAP